MIGRDDIREVAEGGDWRGRYGRLIVSAEEAVSRIKPGQRVFIGTGCGQPQALIDALLKRADSLDDVEVVHLLSLAEPEYRHLELAEKFRLSRFFIADQSGDSNGHGLGDYTPVFLSDIPRLFRSGQLPIDVALVQVTEPNEQGHVSLGISVDITRSAVENAGTVIAQVNRQMPWTAGDSQLYVDDIDLLVDDERPVIEAFLSEPDDNCRRIAEYISTLIPNGSTVEVGTSPISRALLQWLEEKSDLGIHTDVVCDAIIDLMESGAVTGSRKTVDHGKVVASMCMGTRKLYDYIDRNPEFSFRPAEYVSDPHLISRLDNLVAISVGIEIDLTGQVSADVPGEGFCGISSHADFVHGAAAAAGGKLIMALQSTDSTGEVSRIVPSLSRGAGVSATRTEVHYVVTEHGVAYLYGKSLQERAMALISIANPNLRGGLLKAAIEQGYVSSELAAVEGKILVGPSTLKTSTVLADGTQISFRPMHPTDEKRMRELLHSLSKQTMHYRFMSEVSRFPRREIQNFIYTDYRRDMAIVGTVPEAHGEEIIAIGRYYLDPHSNRAEVAFTVRDNWQGRGIGKFLMRYLMTVAKQNGIAGMTAEVLRDNKAMIAILQGSGCKISSSFEGRVCEFQLDFV